MINKCLNSLEKVGHLFKTSICQLYQNSKYLKFKVEKLLAYNLISNQMFSNHFLSIETIAVLTMKYTWNHNIYSELQMLKSNVYVGFFKLKLNKLDTFSSIALM